MKFTKKIVDQLQTHHHDTGAEGGLSGRKMFGHRDFEVFLPNGRKGEIEVYSSIITYEEIVEEE